ncbi:DUF7288 family protein [Halorarum salinum]|uniref:Uncharacterized protein n=1 Tax=Halorarum salinum TaxID=2743089 RepID=A0A7D5QEE3_9EURY|nr:hypothetical protein [Halobaculum salinum]QLG62801.1 hypothetical protein HUG12_14125 [Halobaculum salinum]
MRGQAHTLEAVTAGILLLSTVAFALQVTAVTPLTGSTSNQHIENQQAAMAEGVLDTAAANGTLKPTLLAWNGTAGTFHGATRDGYLNGGPPTPFGGTLNETFRSRGVAMDVTVTFLRGTDLDRVDAVPLVNLGAPSDNSAVATTTVTLYDDDRVHDADGNPTGPRLDETENFYADDVSPDSPVYNVLRIEVVVWRI